MQAIRLAIFMLLSLLACMPVYAQRDVNPPGVKQIQLKLSGTPREVVIKKAPLRYNKRFAMSFHADDGIADVYKVGFRYFTGINSPSGRYLGLYFTDGCGNDVSFKLSSALFSFSSYNKEDMHRPGNHYNTVTWPQLDTMYRNGCGIYNHGFTSDAPTGRDEISYSIKRNESYIRRMLAGTTPGGVKTRVLVNPNGMPEYSPEAFSFGYRYAFRMGAWTIMPENGMNVAEFSSWDKPLELNRLLAETVDVKQLADQLSARSINGAHYWMPVFTHRIIDDYPQEKFFSDWDYIASTYGKKGRDDIWVASEEEILNYLLVQQRVEVNYALKNSILTINLSGHLPPDLRFYLLSLVVQTPGASIVGMNLEDGNSVTHSAFGGDNMLINLSWDGNSEQGLAEVAENAVSIAQKNPVNAFTLVAMDYVLALPKSREKEALRRRLCAINGIDYEPGFCIKPAN